MKKSFFLCLALCAAATHASPISTHYLEEAAESVKNHDFMRAAHYSKLVLKYDEKSSDALYYLALCSQDKLRMVNSYLEAAFTYNNWSNYNEKDAKLLYASSLLETGKMDKALEILQADNELDEKEALLLKIKALYKKREEASIEEARKEAYKACKLFIEDERFEDVFFKNEYALRGKKTKNKALIERIKDTYLTHYKENDTPKLKESIYLIRSVEDKNERARLLRSYEAEGLSSPLYATAALECGVLNEEKALEYFCALEEKEIPFEIFRDFFTLLSEKETVDKAGDYLLSFSGTLTFDTDCDTKANLFVEYKNSRPASARFDSDNDGENEWSCTFDSGNPLKGEIKENNAKIVYSGYPYASCMSFSNDSISFSLTRKRYKYPLFDIDGEKTFREKYKMDFFILKNPIVPKSANTDDIFLNSSSCVVKTEKKEGEYIKFNILDGVIVSGNYFNKDEKNYARLFFNNGIPYKRMVDTDYDGIFETTEIYGFDEKRKSPKSKVKDEIFSRFFSVTLDVDGIYLKKILLDRNADNRVDFVEEYFKDGEKIVTYDTDYDGKNDITYNRRERKDSVDEESAFLGEVYVASKNGECKSVQESAFEKLPVLRGKSPNFFWIGQTGPLDIEKLSLEECKKIKSGAVFIVEKDGIRSLSIEIMGKLYSKIIPAVRKKK